MTVPHSSDFHADPDKHQSREYNISQVKRLPGLYDDVAGKLKRDWLELVGNNAPTFQLLRAYGMLGPAKFFGVDREEKVFDDLRETFGDQGEHHQFFLGELEEMIWRGAFKDVGVLNWDSTHPAGESRFHESLNLFVDFAKQQAENSAFALIINAGINDRHNKDVLDFQRAVEKHGLPFHEEHLKIPGVRYGGKHKHKDRNHRGERISYCILFGAPKLTDL